MQHLFSAVILLGACFFQVMPPSVFAFESDTDFRAGQDLRAEAIKLFRAGDTKAALAKMEEALTFRPGNTALLFNLMFLAVQAEDAARAEKYASQYVALGLVPNEQVSVPLAELVGGDVWSTLKTSIAQNSQQVGSGAVVLSVPTDHVLVEGIAADENGNWYFSTVADGKIIKANSEGEFQVLLQSEENGFGSFFGIQYHGGENALYATYGHVDQTSSPLAAGLPKTGLVKLDPSNGTVLEHWPLPVTGEAQQVADLTISESGQVFVTNAQANQILRLTDVGLEALDLDAAFMNLQGLVSLGEGVLLVADYGRGVWRVDIKSQIATLLKVPAEQTLIGIDGLVGHDGRIFAIQNGVMPHRIVEIQLDKDGQAIQSVQITARALPEFDEPTLGVSTPNGLVVVAASQWPKYEKGGTVRDGMEAAPTAIVRIATE